MEQPLGTPRAEFLERVRQSLGRSAGPPLKPYYRLEEDITELRERAEVVQSHLTENRSELLDRFAEVAGLRGWQVFRTSNPEEAITHIQGLAMDREIESIVRSDQDALKQFPLDEPLRAAGVSVTTVARDDSHSREDLRGTIAASGMGITGADYAIAETGSVIVLPRKGLSRLVSLVPPVHVAVVRPDDLIESLDDLMLFRRLEYHRNGGDMGSYLNFITGPSRTADIEQTIIVGVHGPKEVHLVLLG